MQSGVLTNALYQLWTHIDTLLCSNTSYYKLNFNTKIVAGTRVGRVVSWTVINTDIMITKQRAIIVYIKTL